MRLSKIIFTYVVVLVFATPAFAQMVIPSDVNPTCAVLNFDDWFVEPSPTEDGAVKPADSVNFDTMSDVCDFYKWGAQMFLWLTSPTDGGLVLDSKGLINVTPADSEKRRFLQQHDSKEPLSMALRAAKSDDIIGEVGQAGSAGVLMSQENSLVYYGVHVNDAYGYFLTGQKKGQKTDPLANAVVFPRNADDQDAITTYVREYFPETTLQHPETLVMEFKTSWIDADTIPEEHQRQFVTWEAEVPDYSHNEGNTIWIRKKDPVIKTLALTGIHIVGTVLNHPEFVWITYEHLLNAPDDDYYYETAEGDLAEQSFASDGTFLFMASGATRENSNIECMKEVKGDIIANNNDENTSPKCTGGIVPSNTYREYPWGSKSGDMSDPVVSNNTLLLSLNNSVLSQLIGRDVRKNYVQTGGIWTSTPDPKDVDAPIPNAAPLRGSLFAFNVTMETYTQGTSCFSCHAQKATAPNSFQEGQLSHIYSEIVPLSSEQ